MTGIPSRPRPAPRVPWPVAAAILAGALALPDATNAGPLRPSGPPELPRDPDPPPEVPPGYLVDRVVGPPFDGPPVGFAFLPDGRPLLIERPTGNVRVAPVGATTSRVAYTVPDLHGVTAERGLLGVAVDPAWPDRPYLYLMYIHEDLLGRIAMVRGQGALEDPASDALEFDDLRPLLVDLPLERPYHHGGTLRFGPDRMLYVSLGDNLEACDPQDLGSARGKILRLDVSRMPPGPPGPPHPGELVPPDNPVRGPDPDARLVWATGLRNPFRFWIDPPTGDLWIGDVGEARWEELNVVPGGRGGLNFGWPRREGRENRAIPDTCGLGERFEDPVYAYPHVPGRASAIIGGPLWRAGPGAEDALPAAWDGSYLYVDHNEGALVRLVRRPGTGPVPGDGEWVPAPPEPGQPAPDRWGAWWKWVSDLQQGPDGCLWLVRWDADPGLYRIARDLSAPTAAPPAGRAPGPRPGLRPAPRLDALPNPRGPAAGVRVAWAGAPADRPLDLRIVDVAGRTVRVLASRERLGPRGSRLWDGRGRGGGPVPAGVLFARLADGPRELATVRIVTIR